MHASTPTMVQCSSLLFIAFLVAFSFTSSSSANSLQTYVIHVQRNIADDFPTNNADDLETWYRSFLPQIDTNSVVDDSDRLVYSYSKVFSGFAARLTDEELNLTSKKPGFVRAFPNAVIPLLTTHTPDFLGLRGSAGLWNSTNLGKGVIVGVLDSGILPGHPSFDDNGVPPPPARWKGRCDFGPGGCNNKIIGARAFLSGNDAASNATDPTDDEGHGSHTASTISGNFVRDLGDGREFYGESLYQPKNFTSRPLPLSYHRNTCPVFANRDGLVLCDPSRDSNSNLIGAGAAVNVGAIRVNSEEQGYTIPASDLPYPGSAVSFADGVKIKEYIASVNNPTASISFNGTVLGVSPAPTVAFFSSRGPSLVVPGLLKPDISGPGLNILAAWNRNANSRSSYKVPFNVVSGTSMATPHISGVAALIKSLHSDWSPAMIKSAIMTSSDFQDRDGNRVKDEQLEDASFYAMGAGHVNPSKAARPGLVYDLAADDYIAYLCGAVGENGTSIVARRSVSCSGVKTVKDFELNYPTITVAAASTSGGVTVNRTVTNVGSATAEYKAEVDVPEGVNVTVTPGTLNFSKVNEKLTFSVSVTAAAAAEGNLKWISGDTVVRSALVVTA
ncbi:uncharacterized protein A4U43_C07F6140 [Asparagus officinalis]|uniref:Subtilisin-like protease n=1 Tax=Asparagus officinalis TaxID=4686 RepID=A0A5P1EBQ3_ASPOF|nr:uncharacterized protein A4U43_C07F6140 [Asparagus officinalis]